MIVGLRAADPSPPTITVLELLLLTRPLWLTLILCLTGGLAVITSPFW